MEKDKRLGEIMKENGPLRAPDGFTEKVLNKIDSIPVRSGYKPILNQRVGITIAAVFIILLIIIGLGIDDSAREPLFRLPEFNIKLPEIAPVLTTGFIAGVIATFLLLLSDFGLRSRKG